MQNVKWGLPTLAPIKQKCDSVSVLVTDTKKGKNGLLLFPIRLFIFTLLTLFVLASCSGSVAEELLDNNSDIAHIEDHSDIIELTPESIRAAGIQIEQSKRIEIRRFLEATGTVTPDESRLVHVKPLSRGIIEKVYVRRGDRVVAGDPLVQYDNIELGELIGEYISQHLQLHKYETEVEVAKKLWERGAELLEAQAISVKEVELREAQYKNAQATAEGQSAVIENKEEKLHRFGLSDYDIGVLNERHSGGHRTASHSLLKTPISGVIIEYDAAEGEIVEPTRELMTIADLSNVWVLANIYEKDLGLIKEGQRVEVVALSYPQRVFPGELTYIRDVLESETRTARVRCVVPNPESLLKLRMFVAVRIPTTQKQTAIAVPQAAVQNIDGKEVVFIAEEGHFLPQSIQTGLAAGGWVAVEGLDEGTSVVTNGSFYLKSAFKRFEIGDGHAH